MMNLNVFNQCTVTAAGGDIDNWLTFAIKMSKKFNYTEDKQ